MLDNPASLVDPLGLWCTGAFDQSGQGGWQCGSDDDGGSQAWDGWGMGSVGGGYYLQIGGEARGGGGGGGPRTQPQKAPPPQAPTHPLANCIANSGNEASLQGLLGLGNSKLAGAFLGNPFSDAIQLLYGDGSWGSASGDVVSAAAPRTLRSVPNVSVSYTSMTVTTSPSDLTVITNELSVYLPLGEIATGAAEVLEGFAKVLQIPIDATATGFGAVVCSVAYY